MKGKTAIAVLAILSILIIAAIISIQNYSQDRVCFKEHCFNVELAVTDEEMSHGLMYREKLDENAGMLFIYKTEGNYSFWMMNTTIPLDMIWLDKNHIVVFISKNTQPCKETCPLIYPDKNSMYIIEVNSGTADRVGLDIGEKIEFYINQY